MATPQTAALECEYTIYFIEKAARANQYEIVSTDWSNSGRRRADDKFYK